MQNDYHRLRNWAVAKRCRWKAEENIVFEVPKELRVDVREKVVLSACNEKMPDLTSGIFFKGRNHALTDHS